MLYIEAVDVPVLYELTVVLIAAVEGDGNHSF